MTPPAARAGEPLLLGVRHHGPGSARAVGAALAVAQPRVVLIEGPAEADDVLAFAGREEMRPPVALLAHAQEAGRRGAAERGEQAEQQPSGFWPLAEFSPEWVAVRWATTRGVPVHFIDLPAAHTLALRSATEHAPKTEPPDPTRTMPHEQATGEPPPEAKQPPPPTPAAIRSDPLAALAAAAGHDDAERWWEDAVEHRGADHAPEPLELFEELARAMTELRAHQGQVAERDLVREAHMRLRIAAVTREFAPQDVAVVCGAWHVPALRERRTRTADRALLRGLPRVNTTVTWVPWSHRRLARSSGYGAGVAAPGWYAHLFAAPDRPVERWLVRVAGLLREQDVGVVSPAHVVDSVRLAEALAALRARPHPGLAETLEAARAVLCEGSETPLALVHDRLTVGDVLGAVPPDAPAVPLQRDLTRQQRTLRLQPAAERRELELDLRRGTDAERSRLLHRLRLLDVPWGEPRAAPAGTGTFRERWLLQWQPEHAVRVAEAGRWGNTVPEAATERVMARVAAAGTLAEVTLLAERTLLAALPQALPRVLQALADAAALESDVARLAEALPALVRALRYGDVRRTDAASLGEVAHGLAERLRTGLPAACRGLDADAAARFRSRLDAAHGAVHLLARSLPTATGAALRPRWRAMLRHLAEGAATPPLLQGRCTRILLDEGEFAPAEAARLLARGLTPSRPAAEAAGWIEGFLAGSGLLLVHDTRLLHLLDAWLAGLSAEAFTVVLPVLRRTVAEFEPALRRTLGEQLRHPAPPRPHEPHPADDEPTEPEPGLPGFGRTLETARADAALPTLQLLLAPAPPPAGETPPGSDNPTESEAS